MRNIILTVLMSVAFLSCVQAKQKDINNRLTEKHVNIPGTRLYIIPPSGFEIATSFVGLQGSNSTLQILDVVEGDFYANAATFNKEEFEKMGIKVFEYAEFKVNGFPAKYVHMQGNPGLKTISIVFGNSTFSTMIIAAYASDDKRAEKEIKKAIQTICYDKNIQIDPLATASFTLDESNSIFKFHKSTAGMFIYTIGGENNTEPIILILTLPMDETMTLRSISEMFISALEQKGLFVEEMKQSSVIDVNGLSAYEVEISGEMNDKECLIYLLIVIKQDKAVVIQGVATSDLENNLNEFKKLAKTIKLK